MMCDLECDVIFVACCCCSRGRSCRLSRKGIWNEIDRTKGQNSRKVSKQFAPDPIKLATNKSHELLQEISLSKTSATIRVNRSIEADSRIQTNTKTKRESKKLLGSARAWQTRIRLFIARIPPNRSIDRSIAVPNTKLEISKIDRGSYSSAVAKPIMPFMAVFQINSDMCCAVPSSESISIHLGRMEALWLMT